MEQILRQIVEGNQNVEIALQALIKQQMDAGETQEKAIQALILQARENDLEPILKVLVKLQSDQLEATKQTGEKVAQSISELDEKFSPLNRFARMIMEETTPEKGVDYFTEEETKEFKESVTPVKGEDYFTQKEIDDFLAQATPIVGEDYFTAAEIKQFKQDVTPVKGVDYFDGYTPQKGIDYFDGKKGDKGDKGDKLLFADLTEEEKAQLKGKDGSPDTGDQIISKINKASNLIDLKAIKGWQQVVASLENQIKNVAHVASTGNGGWGTNKQFINLADTPDTYQGHGGKYVRVKSDLSGLEFATVAGGGGGGTWGSITGTLSDQADLQSALNAKANTSHTHAIADVTGLQTALDGKQSANGNLDNIAALTDPNADRLIFWDDSAGAYVHLELGTNLSISGTTLNATGGGGGLSDGDYGDITVGGTGTTMTIDNGAVSLAKMADVATGTIFYRKTASTGSPEVQTLATLKTDLGLTGTNSGDQTSIVGITGTKAEFNTAVTDGNFLYTDDIGVSVQAYDADLTTWASLTPSANAQSLVTAANYAAMRALLDLEAGTDFYSISAANAAFQPLDSDLTTIAGLTPSNDDIIQRKAGAWTNRTIAQFKSDLALTKSDVGLGNVSNVDQIPLSYLDTDVTLAADSDSKVATQKAVKAYVDGVAQGLSIKQSVRLATAAALPANTYLSNVITASANGALTVDGTAVDNGDRILVKDESTQVNNGIYTVTDKGSAGTPFVLTRSLDMNANSEIAGAFTFVEDGTVNDAAGFVVASVGPFTIGTTAIVWTQFSGAGQITAGSALTKSGNTLDVAVDNTTIEVSGDALRIKDDGVTYAKIQNVATDRLLGRVTAGTGDVEEIVFTDFAQTLLDDVDAGTARTTLGLGTAATKATDLADLNEATIEAAIDTLANLTSIQGRTVTLADAGANAVFGWDDVAGAYENLTASEVRAAIGLATSDSPQFTAINLGHASDTTLARVSAGEVSIEGNIIYRAGGTDVPLADGGTGASLVDPNADRIMFWDDSAGAVTWLEVGSGLSISGTTLSSTGGSSTESVAQTSHGLSVGDLIRSNGTNNQFTKAQSDSSANAEVIGRVATVADANNFTYVPFGTITTVSVPAVAAGTVLFLDPSTAGGLTATAPSTAGQVSKPAAIVIANASKMIVFNMRGIVLGSDSTLHTVGALGNSVVKTYFNYQPSLSLYTASSADATVTTGGATVNFTGTGADGISLTSPFRTDNTNLLNWSSTNIIIMDFWAKLAASGTGDVNMGFGTEVASFQGVWNDTSGNGAAVKFAQKSTGELMAVIAEEGIGVSSQDITSGITVTNWNNYRIELDLGNEAKFYVNGVLKATLNGANLEVDNLTLLVGFGRSDTNLFLATAPAFSMQMNP